MIRETFIGKLIIEFITSIGLYILSFLLIIGYSYLLYISGHKFWPNQATGSLIIDQNKRIRGSYLIAQEYNSDKYFKGRRQANSQSKCNVALHSREIKNSLSVEYDTLLKPFDISLISSSSSNLDPYIMTRDAVLQAENIAKVRNIDLDIIKQIIRDNTIFANWPFFTLDIVNVTKLNSLLDEL
ncbi:MAG: potassium-transporting ATPase subunit C [Rickettsiaceae bacterium]|nr:potassium-transporting ATPase subunit C [Rickettsiaceae bacterium]